MPPPIPEQLRQWTLDAPLGRVRRLYWGGERWRREEQVLYAPGLSPPVIEPQSNGGAGLWG